MAMLSMRLTRFIARKTRVRPAHMQGRRPVASITFDDFPKSAWEIGGAILARHQARGTYYTAGNFCGRTVKGTVFYDAGDLRALAAAGHEIGCHGYGHEPTPALSTEVLDADRRRNADFLAPFLNGAKAESYAYPFGASSVRTKKFYAPHFTNLRGVHPGINTGRIDLSQLNAMSVEVRSFTKEKLAAAIAGAQHNNGWISFYTHEVCDSPSEYGATPAMLDEVLKALAQARIDVLPMREALAVALG
jgi:peptidoglycan/xylan/chitin deacetylase (PgdA/CDA1 family)